jgi:hypothetical protein
MKTHAAVHKVACHGQMTNHPSRKRLFKPQNL